MTLAVQPTAPPKRSPLGPILAGVLLLAVVAGLASWGIAARARTLVEVTLETRALAVPIVAVITPGRGAPQQEIVLPGTMQAYAESPIYARTSGYLRARHVDIGAKVRTGQLLAEVDTPELDQQLQQARADLSTAEANARLAQTTAERYRDLIRTESVSRQDLDNANGGLEARLTAVESARANVMRLEQLQAFRRIVSPIDGVVTARNTDVGALIDPGGNARELFHIVSVDRLRVFVSVPQLYSQAAEPGMSADLSLQEFPGRTFPGKLVRTARSIDVASRTLLTEIDVENRKGELLPGSYAQVHLKLPTPQAAFTLPVNALIFRSEGLRVATIVNGRVELTPIVIGRDYGTTVEVISGLNGGERVVINPPDSLEAGQTVRVAEPQKTAAPRGAGQ
jgi:RND family efflux transporter MFP subunit